MANFSKFQEKVIKNYYHNREAMAVQRLQELVTELYLTTGKKRQQHWKNVILHLQSLEVPQAHIDNLVEQDNPEVIAKYIQKFTDK